MQVADRIGHIEQRLEVQMQRRVPQRWTTKPRPPMKHGTSRNGYSAHSLPKRMQKTPTRSAAGKRSKRIERTGGGGGDWRIIRELIQDTLVVRGVPVIVYAPPETKPRESPQQMLPLD